MYPRAVPYAFFFFRWEVQFQSMKHGRRLMRRDAATREGRCCPHVRLRPTATCQLSRGFFFFSQLMPKRLRLGLIRTKSGWLEPYRPKQLIQAEIQKKKKVRNTPFEPNIKPYFQLTSHKHTKQALCLSLTPSLVSHSLCALYLLLIVLLIIFYFVLVSNVWVVF